MNLQEHLAFSTSEVEHLSPKRLPSHSCAPAWHLSWTSFTEIFHVGGYGAEFFRVTYLQPRDDKKIPAIKQHVGELNVSHYPRDSAHRRCRNASCHRRDTAGLSGRTRTACTA